MARVRHRTLILLAAIPSVGLAVAPGCGTNAVGVEACRDIERARCRAGQGCDALDIEDVAACERFYRDQCLHGLAVKEAPSKRLVKSCVAAIEQAGACVTTDPTQPLDACPGEDLASGFDATRISSVCDAIVSPERLVACSFLLEGDAPPTTGGTPGTGGTAGATTDGGSAGDGSQAGASG